MKSFTISLLFVIVASVVACSEDAMLPRCWDPEDVDAEETACAQAGGEWAPASRDVCENTCPSDMPVLMGCCQGPDVDNYLVCVEECVETSR